MTVNSRVGSGPCRVVLRVKLKRDHVSLYHQHLSFLMDDPEVGQTLSDLTTIVLATVKVYERNLFFIVPRTALTGSTMYLCSLLRVGANFEESNLKTSPSLVASHLNAQAAGIAGGRIEDSVKYTCAEHTTRRCDSEHI